MSDARPIPRTVNRWTLEPVLFLLPILLIGITALAAYTFVLALSRPGDVPVSTSVLLLAVLIVLLTVLGLRKKR